MQTGKTISAPQPRRAAIFGLLTAVMLGSFVHLFAETAIDAQALYQRHLDAVGTPETLQAIESITVKGTATENGTSFHFELNAKAHRRSIACGPQ